MFEAFKRSQNLKAWLRFAPQRLQSSREAREKKEKLLYSFSRCSVELRGTNTSVWLLRISSVGRSVRGYVCADLLSIREGSPSKEGFHGTHGTPSRSATASYCAPMLCRHVVPSFCAPMLHVSVLLIFDGNHYSRAAFNLLRASIVRLLFVGCDYSRAASIRRSTADVSMTSSGMVRIPSGDQSAYTKPTENTNVILLAFSMVVAVRLLDAIQGDLW